MNADDVAIISAIRKNPEKGFKVLLSQYSQRVYWHIRRAVNSHQDAEDITQETFLRIFKSIGKLKSEVALKSWIYRIATNEALRFIEKHDEIILPLDNAAGMPSDNYINYTDIEAVELKKAISTLPPKQRMVFNLRYYDELDYGEIASILETTAQNVRANYHNAKERVVKYMNSINWNV